MNKKGSFKIAYEEMLILPRVILISISVIGLIIIVNSYVNRETDTNEVSSFVFSNILLSDECFGANNEFGVIDKNKFRSDNLVDCLKYDVEYLSAEISLGNEKIDYNDFSTRKILCERGGKCSLQSLYVLVKEGDSIKEETMYVEVLINE